MRTEADPVIQKNKIFLQLSVGMFFEQNALGVVSHNEIYENERAGIQLSLGANPEAPQPM